MKLLEDKILKDGKIGEGEVLKVDSFLNHCMDVEFLSKLGEEFYRLYQNCNVNKILTIEASGIGIACLTAQFFKVPVVFAKKTKSVNIYSDVYTSKVESYTHKRVYDVIVSKEFLGPCDNVLIIDDFLAQGSAMKGLIDIVKESGASIAGVGIVIEKAYQPGGEIIRGRGVRVESLARIESMSMADGVKFID